MTRYRLLPYRLYGACLLLGLLFSCGKSANAPVPPPTQPTVYPVLVSVLLEGSSLSSNRYNVSANPVLQLTLSTPVSKNSVAAALTLTTSGGLAVPLTLSYLQHDSVIVAQPQSALPYLTKYTLQISTALQSAAGNSLKAPFTGSFVTRLDSSDKFPRITDSALLTLVEKQTFSYFWDFGHPVSGMARERASNPDLVTTGGSGFGIMALLAGVQRQFITRAQALDRISTIAGFLSTQATRYHGAFPHWMNGSTGATVPFSSQDDGADLVETSYMMAGLLCARTFFNSPSDSSEIRLRSTINALWNGVEWTFFTQGGQQVLYWHWSPDYGWSSNQQINGWNEAMIVYILAASSPVDSNRIAKTVYDNGWAAGGSIKNGNAYFGITLPLGPAQGGPLFFAHYSFLGINPTGLSDGYANYWTQNTAHTMSNYQYCLANPQGYYGYSPLCWGLTASDEQNGYSAHAPGADDGVISPTAAISSMPYAPAQSMDALRFFYYTLGDRTWGTYGFRDAFNLSTPWFDQDYLAIDQGPEVVMIENYRSGLIWQLLMGCPEIKTGLKALGFQGPLL